ncbi:N-terminal C2 in EEIG1 and EHBP1 proteins-domain-containing protein [Cryomyces antarcticus]|nr:hypothetical protein LTR04_003637 [Oleoguttula sp. CCFEE 6159]
MQALGGLTVPKTRRPKFELHLKIHDLNNIPLVSGTSFIKWHLPSSQAAEHRGRTDKVPIKDHRVDYGYTKTIPVRLTVDKNQTLEPCTIHFEILQEYSSAGRGERITLGSIKINLAEYVEASEAAGREGEEDGVTRRYLMQESKINSTLKISISMKQTEGERNFVAPALKNAPAFVGIAGILTAEAPELDDTGHVPSLSTKSRETGELADLYRRTLAAYWTAMPGEMKADECIESIFAGGAGFTDTIAPSTAPSSYNNVSFQRPSSHKHNRNPDSPVLGEDGGALSDNSQSSQRQARSSRSRNASSTNLNMTDTRASKFPRSKDSKHGDRSPRSGQAGATARAGVSSGNASGGAIPGRSGLDQTARQIKASQEKSRRRPAHEVDELDLRQDLRSWRLPKWGVM